MTGLLASVRDLHEARRAATAGADIIDLKDPDRGALGAWRTADIRAAVNALGANHVLSATIGDLPCEAGLLRPAIESVGATGVDLVKVGIFGDWHASGLPALAGELSARGLRLVLVFFAEDRCPLPDLHELSRAGIAGVMLDTRDKSVGTLRTLRSDAELRRFVDRARGAGLLSGLAGSLRREDVAPLCELAPDYLGFRSALCQAGRRGGTLDAGRLADLRTLLGGRAALAAGALAV